METEMQALKQQIETQEREFKDAVHATERKLIQEKSQIKKEMIQQVNDITTSFRDHSVKEMAEVGRAILVSKCDCICRDVFNR